MNNTPRMIRVQSLLPVDLIVLRFHKKLVLLGVRDDLLVF